METYVTCAQCGVHRLAPGLSPDGQPLCPPCAGITVGFVCTACGREARRYSKSTYGHCVLSARLAALLDDGTGQVRPELVPFYDAVRAMDRPRTGILWISKPHVPPILTALARGQVPLTQQRPDQPGKPTRQEITTPGATETNNLNAERTCDDGQLNLPGDG